MKILTQCLAIILLLVTSNLLAQEKKISPTLDVPYVPTKPEVVKGMLGMAGVKSGDVVYDLGCGDGRIVITAVKDYGATGVGVDIDPERIQEANANAEKAGVKDKVQFMEGNLYDLDFSKASVVTLYLLPDVNLKLKPKLLKQLKPGSRIVSHAFNMGDWEPEATKQVNGETIYLWTVPAK